MPIVLFFSSRQILVHPIWNFRANPSTPGRFGNIGIFKNAISLQFASKCVVFQIRLDTTHLYFYVPFPVNISA